MATVGLLDTYPLQSDADPLIGATMDENSNALSDVSMITNPGDYGELLPDCMIVDPLETLPEELFDVSDLWDPILSTPEVLPDIQPPQSSCSSVSSSSSYVPVVVTHCTPLTDMTNTITPDTLTAAAYTANALATGAGLTSQPLLAALAGRTEGENANVKSKRKRSGSGGGGKRKVVLDAEGNEVVVEKKPRAPKKQKKTKEEEVHRSPPAAAAPPAANSDPGVKALYNPQPPSIEGQHCGRERGRVSPISPMVGLTQMNWLNERKDDPPPKPQCVYHSKTCRSIAVLVYGPPDPLRVSKLISRLSFNFQVIL